MSTEDNNQEADTQPQEGEGAEESGAEEQSNELAELKAKIDSFQSELSERDQTIGSLKRELKSFKKTKETPKETPESQTEDNSLLQKAFLRAAGITDGDEVELALNTSNKWDVTVDKLVDDEDFKIKLEKLRTQKSNEIATSGVKGDPGKGSVKNTPEYWISKGLPPSREDVPDRKTRAKIARAMMANEKSSKMFYND